METMKKKKKKPLIIFPLSIKEYGNSLYFLKTKKNIPQ